MKLSIKNKLDKLWRDKIKEKAINKCEICGITFGIESHHFIKRRYSATRWLLKNGFCLCQRHHMWAESFPVEFKALVIRKRGQVWFDKLMEIKRIVKPVLDIERIQKKLK